MADDHTEPAASQSCSWCAKQIPALAKICPACGTALSDAVAVRQSLRGPRIRERPTATVAGKVVADLGARWWGGTLDSLLIGLPLVLTLSAVGFRRTALFVLATGATFLYEAGAYAIWGRTLGKRLAGTVVIALRTGQRPTIAQAVARAAFAAIPALPLILWPRPGILLADAIGVIIYSPALANLYRRGLHDRVAGIVVVRSSS